jgi:hypothetical protein
LSFDEHLDASLACLEAGYCPPIVQHPGVGGQ